MYMNNPKVDIRGWMCPICGHVFAPWVGSCPYCPINVLSNTDKTNEYTTTVIKNGKAVPAEDYISYTPGSA